MCFYYLPVFVQLCCHCESTTNMLLFTKMNEVDKGKTLNYLVFVQFNIQNKKGSADHFMLFYFCWTLWNPDAAPVFFLL